MRRIWHRHRLHIGVLVFGTLVLLVFGGVDRATIGQTINGIMMPGNPYFHQRQSRGFSYGNQSASRQLSSIYGGGGGGGASNVFGTQRCGRKPFTGALQSNRPLVTSMDAARITITRGMGGWYY